MRKETLMNRMYCIVSSRQNVYRLRKPKGKSLKIYSKKSFCIVSLMAFLATWVYLIGTAYADEIRMIDGTVFEGEIVNVNGEFISFRKTDDTVSDILLDDVNLISGGKEIIIVDHEGGKKVSFLRIPKPENFSIKEAVHTKTDTLTLFDMGIETTKIAAEEAVVVQQTVPDNAPSVISKEEVQPLEVNTPEAESSTAQATTANVEEIAQAGEETEAALLKAWRGNFDAGISVKDGNTESTTVHLKGSYANERATDNIYFDAIALYETVTDKVTDEDVETINEQKATGKYEYKHTPRFYSFFNQYFEHDEIEDLNYRFISSPGAGYRVIDKEWLRYRAEAGPAYTYERFHGGITDDYFGVRVGQYVDWVIRSDTKLYAKSEYTQSVENSDDWRVDSGLGIRHNLTNAIALSLEFLDQYDNTPAEGNEKEDRTFIGSVGYNF
ncbi:MAG: DUF481 domain-containing protein [wastewater metagenome]|nr:DUF481 domain-containing protein [Candidatus Loosdrechtia aerotolerans]